MMNFNRSEMSDTAGVVLKASVCSERHRDARQ